MRSRVAENAMEMARIPEHPQFALSSADGRTNFRRHLVNASTVAAFMLFGLLFGFERSALAAGEPGAGERREEAVEAGSDLLTPKHDSFTGSDAVQSQLGDDREAKKNLLGLALLEDWQTAKNAVYDRIGLRFGFDYNALGYVATDSPGDEGTASGVFRAYGSWEFFGRGTKDPSGLIYKLEHRHRYTKVPPRDFARELGYVGDINVAFNRQEFRITHLHWRQSLFRQRLIVYAGFLDTTDYVDVYAAVSPWTAFSNSAFSNGSGTIGGLPDGAMGAMVGGFLTDHFYAVAGMTDANSDPTDVFDGLETFFTEFETFKSLEFGLVRGPGQTSRDNVHVTFWQIDEREEAGTPNGWGVNFSATCVVGESWLPFLRGGWAKDGNSLYEGSISAGFAYQRPGHDDLLGVGLSWSLPNDDTFGADLDSQFTGEVFYRLQLTEYIQVTPSLQLLGNPASNPEDDFIAVFGLRARVAF